jgi:hypothetical protein
MAIRASPNAVGEEATPPEFSFFEAPRVRPRPAVHHVCGQEIADISVALWAEIFSAHGVRNAKRVAYLW